MTKYVELVLNIVIRKFVNCLIVGMAYSATLLVEGVTQQALGDVPILLPSPEVNQLPAPSLPKLGASVSEQMNRTEAGRTPPEFDTGTLTSPFGANCDIIFTATPAPAAMVLLSLTAPCRRNEVVVIRQEPLIFSATTSALGRLFLSIPALKPKATFNVEFADGVMASASTAIPDSENYGRVLMQWAGESNLNIHALETGRKYSRIRHVWAGDPGSSDYAQNLRGGYLTELGNNIMRAEIYSYPVSQTRQNGVVRLNIAVNVTGTNCGESIMAEVLQSDMDGDLSALNITVLMPECVEVGSVLTLKNALRSVMIAQR